MAIDIDRMKTLASGRAVSEARKKAAAAPPKKTAFEKGDKVVSSVDAQGLKKGKTYEVVDVEVTHTPFGGFTSYQVSDGSQKLWIGNGHLILSPATEESTQLLAVMRRLAEGGREPSPVAVKQARKDAEAGMRAFAARANNAEAHFIATLMNLGGLSREDAETAAKYYIKKKLVKFDHVGGTSMVKNGAYLDPDAIARAVELGAELP